MLKPGTYDENIIMNKAVILQGLGTGGNAQTAADPTAEPAPLIPGHLDQRPVLQLEPDPVDQPA